MICSFCDILLQILGIGGQLLENQMYNCVCHMSHMSHIDIKIYKIRYQRRVKFLAKELIDLVPRQPSSVRDAFGIRPSDGNVPSRGGKMPVPGVVIFQFVVLK